MTAAPSPAPGASHADDERLDRLRSAFIDPALERDFRAATAAEWARRIRRVAALAALLLVVAAYVDYHALGWSAALAQSWGLRAVLAAGALGIAAVLSQPSGAARLDAAALALMVLLGVFVLGLTWLGRKGVARESPAVLLCVLTFYAFIPARFALQLAAGLSLSALFVWAQLRWGPPATADLALAAAQLVVCNALGVHAALQEHASARGEFLALRKEQRHKQALQASVAALEKSNAELEQFASVASHDLQSPLRNIISFAQLLQRRHGGALGAAGQEYLATIQHSAGHMQGLITDLLAFARVGRGGPAPGPVAMERVLADAQAALAATIRDKGARITHDPLPVVAGTETELRQLLQNLLDNAMKFQAGATPEVHVSARPAGANWEIAVRDNGIGIRPEHQDRIFRMFERLHDTDSYAGTGIGLAVCRKIVEQHGGRIGVESRPGAGSTFRFSLPAA